MYRRGDLTHAFDAVISQLDDIHAHGQEGLQQFGDLGQVQAQGADDEQGKNHGDDGPEYGGEEVGQVVPQR